MGSQFAIIYDVVLAVVLVMAVFGGFRKGFVSTIVSMAAVFVAFFCALGFCSPAAEWLYKTSVEKPVSEAVSSTLDDSMGKLTLSALSDMDYSKVTISGVPADEVKLNYEGTGKVIVELSDVGLSGTGFEKADLSSFGFDGTENLSSMNGKTAELTMNEVSENGLGKLAAAQVIAVKLQGSSVFTALTEYTTAVGDAVPTLFGGMAQSIDGGELSALRALVLTMMNTSSSVKTAVVDNIIRPTFMIAMETLFFVLIFAIVTAVLEIIASALKVVNKIPVIGSLNGFLGGCTGLVKGLLSVCIICIVVRFIVTLTNGEVMLLNDQAIEATYVFRYFYNFDLLNFLS